MLMTLAAPAAMLFDWHGTLVDTVDAMYRAIDDLFPLLAKRGLLERLLDPGRSRSVADVSLLDYVRKHKELEPGVRAARKLSRTEIFEALFGSDLEAKAEAHRIYDDCYRTHCGEVRPFEPGIGGSLQRFKARGLRLGIVTNRNREFLVQELALIDAGSWRELFDVIVCGDDVPVRKPASIGVLQAVATLGHDLDPWHCWNVGDSSTDIIAARGAGVAAIFYNGAHWDKQWLRKIFPRSREFPEAPHAVVENFGELERLSVNLRAEQ
jgi:phosphoglycolate phosphatase